MKNHISRKLLAGEVLKPWLVAGPVNRDMSGKLDERTFFENPRCDVGRDALAEFLKQMGPELAEASPRAVSYTHLWAGRSLLVSGRLYPAGSHAQYDGIPIHHWRHQWREFRRVSGPGCFSQLL